MQTVRKRIALVVENNSDPIVKFKVLKRPEILSKAATHFTNIQLALCSRPAMRYAPMIWHAMCADLQSAKYEILATKGRMCHAIL